ncbi:DUF7344 domain-containing protein [Halobacterium jilantaiense]|uniref:DUF7344 domain-containing protein n=1 Tax=Halobacterium jilantaiense TaxID=355548 RepID=A0A1I0PF23_9EURY|nr:hypothetical protein [Halobacterium jilantaiense]SEW13018.1 hypothetical protein SAMN04487945_1645 [Halobacterium jilantaiense]
MSQTLTEFTDDLPRIADLTETERHTLLRDDRRRLVLDVFAERPSTVTLSEVATEIDAREGGYDADSDAVERVEVSLHHTHLPKMDELGVLSYRPETHHIVQ